MMQYYKEAQQKKQQDKYGWWQQQEIAKSNENMQQSVRQVLCRTLRYCRNGGDNPNMKVCMYCKWNKRCFNPRGDFYKPLIPDLKVLP